MQKIFKFVVLTSLTFATQVNTQPMSLVGKLEVTDSGAASYTVPLTLSPDTGTNDPQLSLVYNSQSGNGVFGVGWSLSGVSSITRCAKNIVEDGFRVGVKNDASDLFCLDGQKLRAISGGYGSHGTQYRTSRDNYSRITSFGTAGTGPQWFRVELKNGQILEFGNTTDARLEHPATGTVRVWMLSKKIDRSVSGNPIAYSYQKNLTLGEQLLTSVQYNNGRVEVEYETRPVDDRIVKYDNGVELGSTDKRAKLIKLYARPLLSGTPTLTLFKEYRLTYTQSGSTFRSLLSQVQECAPNGVCLPAMKMQYQLPNIESLVLSNIGVSPWGSESIPADIEGKGYSTFIYDVNKEISGRTRGIYWDFNGDSKSDLLKVFEPETGAKTAGITLSNGSLGSGGQINGQNIWVNPNEIYSCIGDFNGDGITEFLGLSGNDIPIISSWMNAPILGISSPSIVQRPNLTNMLPLSQPCQLADFNGDGVPELTVFEDGYLWFYRLDRQANGFYSINSWGPYYWDTYYYPVANAKSFYGDFNGDGKTDLFTVGKNSPQYLMSFSNGQALLLNYKGGGHLGFSLPSVCTGDFNSDGRTDIFISSTGQLGLSTSTDIKLVSTSLPPTLATNLSCADFNGDGRADIHMNGQIWTGSILGQPDLLVEVDNNVGRKVQIQYKPLTDNTVYSKGTGSVYPLVDIQNTTYVVARQQTSDGRGGWLPISYRYESLRSDLQRNGSVGFSKITHWNELTGIAEQHTYLQHYPYIGLKASSHRYKGTQTLQHSQISYQAYEQTAQYARVHPIQTETRTYDLNGAFVNWIIETQQNIDGYGNPAQQIIERRAANGVTVTSRQTHTHTYTNDTTRWLLGQLTHTSTASQVNSSPISASVGTAPLAALQNGTQLTPPTLNVVRNPNPMVAGRAYSLTWSSTNANSVSYQCTSTGAGFVGNATLAPNGSSSGTASSSWVGNPSTCIWTATGPGGSATWTETLTTVSAPTLNVTRTPTPMVAGQNYTVSWNTTNATSVNYHCTSSGTGFNGSATVNVNGSMSATANSAWVGNPSSCVWTATSSQGVTTTVTETMTTQPAPINLSFSLSSVLVTTPLGSGWSDSSYSRNITVNVSGGLPPFRRFTWTRIYKSWPDWWEGANVNYIAISGSQVATFSVPRFSEPDHMPEAIFRITVEDSQGATRSSDVRVNTTGVGVINVSFN